MRNEAVQIRGHRHETALAPAVQRARSAVLSPLSQPWAWGVAGFLAGAIFWHLVGFWSFVADVVYRPPAAAAGSGVVQAQPAVVVQGACTSLVLERVSGTTRQAGCPNLPLTFAADPKPGREDKLRAHLLRPSAPGLR